MDKLPEGWIRCQMNAILGREGPGNIDLTQQSKDILQNLDLMKEMAEVLGTYHDDTRAGRVLKKFKEWK